MAHLAILYMFQKRFPQCTFKYILKDFISLVLTSPLFHSRGIMADGKFSTFIFTALSSL